MGPDAEEKIRIMVVDDHAMVRRGLRSFLSYDGLEVIGEAADGAEAVALFRNLQPDITIMDVRLPVKSGIMATEEIVREFPQARIIVVTTFEGDGYIHAALEAGACAYLLKNALEREIVDAIRTVHRGKKVLAPAVASTLAESYLKVRLTPREREVLQLMSKGLRNREIGDVLGTTEGTVKTQVRQILAKLDVEDRTEAVSIALQRGLVEN